MVRVWWHWDGDNILRRLCSGDAVVMLESWCGYGGGVIFFGDFMLICFCLGLLACCHMLFMKCCYAVKFLNMQHQLCVTNYSVY